MFESVALSYMIQPNRLAEGLSTNFRRKAVCFELLHQLKEMVLPAICLILPNWVGSAAFDTSRLAYEIEVIELRIRVRPFNGGRDTINFRQVAKLLEIVFSPIYSEPSTSISCA